MYSFFKLDSELKMWMFTVGLCRKRWLITSSVLPGQSGNTTPTGSTLKPKISTYQTLFLVQWPSSLLLSVHLILCGHHAFFSETTTAPNPDLFRFIWAKYVLTSLIFYFPSNFSFLPLTFSFSFQYLLSTVLWSWYYSHIPDCLCLRRCSPFSSAM